VLTKSGGSKPVRRLRTDGDKLLIQLSHETLSAKYWRLESVATRPMGIAQNIIVAKIKAKAR